MSGSVNKVILVGNLGRDPEVKTLQDNSKVVLLSVATSESWKDKQSGEKRERVEWTRVVIWNEHLADIAERYLRKGSQVYLQGALQTRKWTDKDGVEKYTTEVVLAKFKGELTMLSSGGNGGNDELATTGSRDQGKKGAGSLPAAGGGGVPDLDDDIPFATSEEYCIGSTRFGRNRLVF